MNPLNSCSLLKDRGFIDGQWAAAAGGDSFAVTNPATGEILGSVAMMSSADAERAITGAKKAFPAWRRKMAHERAALLRDWAPLIRAQKDELALILTSEQGKPLQEALGEVLSTAAFLEWFAEEARRVDGEVLQPLQADQRMLVLKEPIGVCAAITPWNFPVSMIARKVAPALAAGCTIVVKPSELTPLSALALAELANRAGFPPGVLSVICGDAKAIGEVFCSREDMRKLSFTGSTATGRVLMAQASSNIQKLSLELGGNAPLIVFDDADVDAAAKGAAFIKFRNMGQMCISANRIYVQSGIHDQFVEKLRQEIAALRVGRGIDAQVTQGPLINEAAVKKVERHIAEAISRGAKIEMGGQRHALGGTFFEPTLLTSVSPDMELANEETFGPVAAVFRFDTTDQVIEFANSTPFGLAAYFYSNDHRKIWTVAEALEYGMIGVNTVLIANEVGPFGGVKQSGLGREGSRHGINEYLELKYVCLAA